MSDSLACTALRRRFSVHAASARFLVPGRLLLLALIAAGPLAAQRVPAPGAPRTGTAQRVSAAAATLVPELQSCHAQVTKRAEIRDAEGNPVYIGPDGVMAQDGDLLLYGESSATISRPSDPPIRIINQNALDAALYSRTGSTTLYPRPDHGQLQVVKVRGAPIGGGRWALVQRLQNDSAPSEVRAKTAQLHVKILNKTRIESDEVLSMPEGMELNSSRSLSIAHHGSRTVVTAIAQTAQGTDGVLIFERRTNGWSSRFLKLLGATYATAGFSGPRHELILSIVHPVLAREDDRSSMHLHFLDRGQSTPRILRRGTVSVNFGGSLTPTNAGSVLTWDASPLNGRDAPYTVYASVLNGEIVGDTIVISQDGLRPTSLVTGSQEPLVAFGRAAGPDSTDVELVSPGRTSATSRVRIATLGAGAFTATRDGDNVVVTAPQYRAVGTYLVSELVWLKPRCPASGDR